jgi:hypothetical protein
MAPSIQCPKPELSIMGSGLTDNVHLSAFEGNRVGCALSDFSSKMDTATVN